jgi:hypothetical protein
MTTQTKRRPTKAKSEAVDTPAPRPPRETKRARLIGLLKAAKGSDVAALSGELGWQHHSTRAALTGLRKAGFIIEQTRSEGGSPACYRIMASPVEAAAR